MAKIQRIGRNSGIRKAALAGSISDDVPLPDGVVMRGEADMIIWRQFTRMRAQGDWREVDLLSIAKIVRLEADIRNHQLQLDSMGAIVENDLGTPIPNPLIKIIDTLQRQQLSMIRLLGINQQSQNARTLNDAGKKQSGYRTIIEQNGGLIPGLDD